MPRFQYVDEDTGEIIPLDDERAPVRPAEPSKSSRRTNYWAIGFWIVLGLLVAAVAIPLAPAPAEPCPYIFHSSCTWTDQGYVLRSP